MQANIRGFWGVFVMRSKAWAGREAWSRISANLPYVSLPGFTRRGVSTSWADGVSRSRRTS